MLTVSLSGGGNFSSITEALSALSADPSLSRHLYLRPGVYREQVSITLPGVTLTGEDAASTVITGHLGASDPMEDGSRRGTFRTYTMLVDADDVTLEGLTIENTAGDGRKAGQAIALYADGNRLTVRNCRLLGHQDTLFTGPLPPTERQKGGFRGPKEFAPCIVGDQFYQNCYIEGDVDFIFGSARARFINCELHSLDRGEEINGYVTAASTPAGEPFGYIFHHCRFTGDCADASVYLGRPWREYASVVLLECELGSHIHPEGWHDWDGAPAHDTAFFAEYSCSGPGSAADKRPDWIRLLTPAQAEAYRKEVLFS